ncbi:MAG: FkbM family methyltransferase [Cyanobacteria bacterium P01_F01_bin.150]
MFSTSNDCLEDNQAALDARHFYDVYRERFKKLPPIFTLSEMFPYYGFVQVKVGDASFWMFSANDCPVALHYFWKGQYEPTSTKVWEILCRQINGLVLDVGSHTGLYSLIANAHQCSVIAYEPVSPVFARLQINVQVNSQGRISVRQRAVSNKEKGKVYIPNPRMDTLLPTGSKIVEDDFDKDDIYAVPSISLDHDILKDTQLSQKKVSLLKIDVEGHEHEVIQGMVKLLESYFPILLVECLTHTQFLKCQDLLKKMDYCAYQILESQQRLIPQTKQMIGNILFINQNSSHLDLIEEFAN